MSGIGRAGIIQALALAAGLLLAGCQGGTGQRIAFPATWPGSEPLSAEAPTVHVLPIQIPSAPSGGPEASREGLPTAAVLSALFVKYLHVNGLNASLDPPDGSGARYLLQCRVPQLSYDVSSGYPQTRLYQAELACLLTDAQTQQAIWERRLTQRYDKTALVDLMTKLPDAVHEDARTMYRECIVPLWDAMAQSVATVVVSEWRAAATPAPEGIPGVTHPEEPSGR